MDAHVDFIDPQAKVMWISFAGRGDELAANLKSYCIEHVQDIRYGRVGILFHGPCPEGLERGGFAKSCELLIGLLTTRKAVSKKEEAAFTGALSYIQDAQSRREAIC